MKADYATVDGRAFFSRGIESLHNDFQPIADAMKEINKGRGMFKYDATSRTATLTSDMGLPLDGAPALTTADMHAISANIRQHKFISGYGGRAAEQKALRARLDKNVDRMSDTARAVYNVMAAQTPTSDYMSTTGGIAP
jgi:hypothetical protein